MRLTEKYREVAMTRWNESRRQVEDRGLLFYGFGAPQPVSPPLPRPERNPDRISKGV